MTFYIEGHAVGLNSFFLGLLEGLESMHDPPRTSVYVSISSLPFLRKSFPSIRFVGLPFLALPFVRLLIHHLLFFFLQRNGQVYLFPANFLPLLAPRKSFLVVHDLNFLINPVSFSKVQLLYRKLFSKYSIKTATAVISISRQTSTEIRKYTGRLSTLIYNPVSLSYPSPSDPEIPLVLCASSLSSHKNIASAVEAVNLFLRLYPTLMIDFTFIGPWALDDFPPIGDDSRISPLGFVSFPLKASLFSGSTAILHPSVYEGFGIPYVEAMLLKKCLICSDIDIVREISSSYPYYIAKPYAAPDILESLESAYLSAFRPKVNMMPDLNPFSPAHAAKSYLDLIMSS